MLDFEGIDTPKYPILNFLRHIYTISFLHRFLQKKILSTVNTYSKENKGTLQCAAHVCHRKRIKIAIAITRVAVRLAACE